MNTPNVPNSPGGMSAGVQPGMPSNRGGGGLFTTRNIIIGLVGLLFLCVCGCVAIFAVTGGAIGTIFSQVAAPAGVGAQFMGNVIAGDYNAAYDLCGSSLKRELGSAANLGKRISDARAKPVSFVPSSTNLNNDRLEMSGTATFDGGRNGTFELVIEKDGNDWKVTGFNLKPN